MPMPWIKLYTDVLDDPKLGRLSDSLKWRFVQLCVFAGECDAEGYLTDDHEPLSVTDIAWRLRIPANTLQVEIDELAGVGLVQEDDGIFLVTAFSTRQGRSQSEKRARWRDRKQRQRDRERDTDDTEDRDTTRDNGTDPEDVTRDTHRDTSVTPGPRAEQSRVETEQSRDRKEADRQTDGVTRDAAAVAAAGPSAKPSARDPTAVSARLKQLGIGNPKRDQLAAIPSVTVDGIDAWWRYISSWDQPEIAVPSLIKRLEANRQPPPEYRKEA